MHPQSQVHIIQRHKQSGLEELSQAMLHLASLDQVAFDTLDPNAADRPSCRKSARGDLIVA